MFHWSFVDSTFPFHGEVIFMKVAFLLFALIVSACGETQSDSSEIHIRPENHQVRWTEADKPTILADDMIFEFDKLPTSGEAKNIPWAGSYWPTWQDNINFRWDGEERDSPAAKYW